MEHVNILTGNETCVNKVVKNQWLTPEVIAMMDKIIKEKWFVREVIYPKEVPGCEIFDYNGCKRLYHNTDRFFALEGERLNSEAGKYCNLNTDFFSAERIIIQQRDDEAFDHWCNTDPFELTSLWPERQLVIATRRDTKQLVALAPVFEVCKSSAEMKKSFEFEKEFLIYKNNLKRSLDKTKSSEALAFLNNSYNLLLWLKNHCY